MKKKEPNRESHFHARKQVLLRFFSLVQQFYGFECIKRKFREIHRKISLKTIAVIASCEMTSGKIPRKIIFCAISEGSLTSKTFRSSKAYKSKKRNVQVFVLLPDCLPHMLYSFFFVLFVGGHPVKGRKRGEFRDNLPIHPA